MEVLLIGATGYLGSGVAAALRNHGHAVRALLRSHHAGRGGLAEDIAVRRGDLLDAASLREAAHGVEVVVHAGGPASDWAPDLAALVAVHADGLHHVLRLREEVGVRRVVALGTTLALDPKRSRRGALQSAPDEVLSLPYQRAKRAAREVFVEEAGDEDLLVHPGFVFGAGPRTEGNSLVALADGLEAGRLPALPRVPPARLWPFTARRRLAEALAVAVTRPEVRGERVLVDGDLPFLELIEIVRRARRLGRLPPRLPRALALAGAHLLEGWDRLRGRRPRAPAKAVALAFRDLPFAALSDHEAFGLSRGRLEEELEAALRS